MRKISLGMGILIIMMMVMSVGVFAQIEGGKWEDTEKDLFMRKDTSKIVSVDNGMFMFYESLDNGSMGLKQFDFKNGSLCRIVVLLHKMSSDSIYEELSEWLKFVKDNRIYTDKFFMYYINKKENTYKAISDFEEVDDFFKNQKNNFLEDYYNGNSYMIMRGENKNTFTKIILDYNEKGEKRLYQVYVDKDSNRYLDVYMGRMMMIEEAIRLTRKINNSNAESDIKEYKKGVYNIISDLGK